MTKVPLIGLSFRALQWCSFDAGYWALTSVTLATLLPYAFKQAMGTDPTAPMAWGAISAVLTLFGALMGPFIGIVADKFEKRKFLLFTLVLVDIAGVLGFVFVGFVHWILAFVFFGIAFMANILILTLYNAMIMFMEEDDDVSMVSVWGAAIANLGAGSLMLGLGMMNLTASMLNYHYYMICTIAASIFCLCMVMPMWIYFPEPPSGHHKITSISVAVSEMKTSFRSIIANKELVKLVIALFIFSDAANTMWAVTVVYGATVGIAGTDIFGAQVLGRFIAVPFCAMWGYFATIFTARTNTLISMGVGVVSCGMLAILSNSVQFWVLTVLLACTGTGFFVFTRILIAEITPPKNAGQNFGFLAFVNKLSGFVGPFFYSLLGYVTGSARVGFYVLTVLGALSMILLLDVDVHKAKLEYDVVISGEDEEKSKSDDTTTKPYQNVE